MSDEIRFYDKYELGARYVRAVNGSKDSKWTDEQEFRLRELVESWDGPLDGQAFCQRLAVDNGGLYRTPGAVGLALSHYRFMVKRDAVNNLNEVLRALWASADEMYDAAKAWLAAESAALRRDGRKAHMVVISTEAAADLAKTDKSNSRLKGLPKYLDTHTGLRVIPIQDFWDRIDKLVEKNYGKPLTRDRLPSPRVTDLQATENIMNYLKQHGTISGKNALRAVAGIDGSRIESITRPLIDNGRIVVATDKNEKRIRYSLPLLAVAAPQEMKTSRYFSRGLSDADVAAAAKDYITREPGSGINQIRLQCHVSRGRMIDVLKKMTRRGTVSCVMDKNKGIHCYYPTGAVPVAATPPVPAPGDQAPGQITMDVLLAAQQPMEQPTMQPLRPAAKQKICGHCQRINDPDAKFCEDCLRPFKPKCKTCGHVGNSGSKGCNQCGTPWVTP